MVTGSAVIAGCFFAGQSIGYSGVFLLLVIPGLLALSRSAIRGLRALCLGSAIVIVLLMWGECLRRAFDGGFGFWLLRELGWWWSVSVMLTLVADFLGGRQFCKPPLLGSAGGGCARRERPGCHGSAARARAASRPRTSILLKAGAAQAGQAVLLEGALPRPVLLLGQLVAPQGVFEGDAAGAHGGDDGGLATHDPAPGVWRRQVIAHCRGFRRRPFERINHRALPKLWRPRTTGRVPPPAVGATGCGAPRNAAARPDRRRREWPASAMHRRSDSA